MKEIKNFNGDFTGELRLRYADAGIFCGFPSPAQDYMDRTLNFNEDIIKSPSAGDIVIRFGRRDDAPFIGKTITEAMGHELCIGLAEGEENLPKVLKLFTDLASTETAQYSYKNTLVAVDKDDKRIGAIIGYDGAGLRKMREDFIAKANELLGWNVTVEEADNWEPETNSGEIYLDSLYVIPEYRNRGIASFLIKAAIERYKNIGKPFGLLVEPRNIKAHKLYNELGFKEDGINNFCGEPMIHLSYGKK